MDKKALNKMMELGYVMRKKHPIADVWIYNYTQKAQYEGIWNDITEQCRGLIMDVDLNILARPFRKFYNLSEIGMANLPTLPFQAYEKMDGSLGVLYWLDDKPYIATRGSFESDQAIKANDLLYTKYKNNLANLDVNNTYIFEIIYPENRIVVDYGKEEQLVLIGIQDTKSGVEKPLSDIGFPLPKNYVDFNKIEDVLGLNWSNHEGFVLKFNNGFRVKVKFEEYVDLHRIITQVSSYTIWEQLATNGNVIEYIELIPDEFYDWVRTVEAKLKEDYKRIEDIALKEFKELETDKETALYIKTCKYPSILFAKWKNRNYEKLIWKMIKPPFEKAFTNKTFK